MVGFTIAVGGPPVTATIGQPGAVSRFTFTANAGRTVTLDATDATLADQCSPILLLGPSGTHVSAACVIDGTGRIRPVTLPDTGTYTVLVDPSGDSTGTVRLALGDG